MATGNSLSINEWDGMQWKVQWMAWFGMKIATSFLSNKNLEHEHEHEYDQVQRI